MFPPQRSAVHVYNKVTLFCFVSPSYVLLELVETERDYVRDLGSVVEVNKKNIDLKWVLFKCVFCIFYKWVWFSFLRATWAGWKRREFLTTWEEKTRSSLEISIRFMTGTKSRSSLRYLKTPLKKKYHYFNNSGIFHSFFLGELEKCLEDPDKLAPLFVKQVKNLCLSNTEVMWYKLKFL